MTQVDDLLGGLLGGKGGVGGTLGGLAGGRSSGSAGGLMGALLPMIGGMLAGGGLSKLLGAFQAQGLSSQADSWVGTGPNEPVTPGQVTQALGDDQIGQIAEKLGVSHDEAAQAIAEALPQVVDRVSPEGQLPPDQELNQAFDRLAQATPAT
jgi:uncharacterized protein YidB (DUF937 family)